jgi:hypothetical protein
MALPFSQKTFITLFALMSAALLVLYIFQINALTGQVYRIAQQERELKTTQKDLGNKEQEFLGTLSRKNLQELAQDFSFERVSGITYIQVLGGVAQSQ